MIRDAEMAIDMSKKKKKKKQNKKQKEEGMRRGEDTIELGAFGRWLPTESLRMPLVSSV